MIYESIYNDKTIYNYAYYTNFAHVNVAAMVSNKVYDVKFPVKYKVKNNIEFKYNLLHFLKIFREFL